MNTIQTTHGAAGARPGTMVDRTTPGESTTSRATVTDSEPAATSLPDPAVGMPALDPEAARQYVQQVQEVLRNAVPEPHSITFRQDEAGHGFVIEVRNPDGSVIRQYPPEKLLNLRRRLDEMSGMVIDEMT